MQVVIDFIIQNWQMILAALLMVLTFIISLLKKKPVYNEIDNILLSVVEKIPLFINSVESTSMDGSSKKVVVMETIRNYVKSQFSYVLSDSLLIFFDQYVELVLSTPQKHKEVFNDEKRK